MVDIDSPILVQEPFLDQPTPKPNSKHPIKTILIFIIFFIVLSLVVALTVIILVGKKKQATSSYVSMVTTTPGPITHASPTVITNESVTTIKYTSTTTATYTSPTTIESSTNQVTIGTNSVDSTTATMITCKKCNEKTFICTLNLKFYPF
jgi:flagellar basal body-associated protein FliL